MGFVCNQYLIDESTLLPDFEPKIRALLTLTGANCISLNEFQFPPGWNL